jgi:hypothetical protein
MGILTRKQGTGFVIGSDRSATDAPTTRPPKGRLSESIAVWTGETWSAVMTEAMTFETLDDADEYVKANYSKVAVPFSPAKLSIKRPVETVTPSPLLAEP